MRILIDDLIVQLIQIQRGKNWIGINFQQQLKSLTEKEFYHQENSMHSIAEIISHLITWRKETIIKIKTGKGSITDDHPSNWQSNEALKSIGKYQLLRNYEESLAALVALLKSKNDSFLDESYFDTDFKGYYPYSFVVKGMIHHDLYHLGQIGLIIKLMNMNNNDQP